MSTKKILGGVILVGASVAVSVGIASGSGATASAGGSGSSASGSPASLAHALGSFSALRTSGTSIDAIGARAAKLARFAANGEPVAVHQIASRGDFQYYVLEGGTQVCTIKVLTSGVGGAGCTSDAAALATGLVSRTYVEDQGWRIFALVPDGTSNVTLVSADGSVREVQVANNLATALDDDPRSISWVLPGGERRELTFSAVDDTGQAVRAPAEVTRR